MTKLTVDIVCLGLSEVLIEESKVLKKFHRTLVLLILIILFWKSDMLCMRHEQSV
jgi:hypothetical protein